MQDVAKRCDISYDRLCYRYKNILLQLQEYTGFLAEYKKPRFIIGFSRIWMPRLGSIEFSA